VIKRDLIEGEGAQAAQAAVKKLMRAHAREKSKRTTGSGGVQVVAEPEPAEVPPNTGDAAE
jgi:hypothetical protein